MSRDAASTGRRRQQCKRRAKREHFRHYKAEGIRTPQHMAAVPNRDREGPVQQCMAERSEGVDLGPKKSRRRWVAKKTNSEGLQWLGVFISYQLR